MIKFKITFSHNNLSNVDINDFFSKMKALQIYLPNVLMSTLEILEFVKTENCYQNVSNCLSNPINDIGNCSICQKKIFKVKIIEILLKIVNITKKIKWSINFIYGEKYVIKY